MEKETFPFASSEEATAVGSQIIVSVDCKLERLSDRNFIKTIPEGGDPLQSDVVKVFCSIINDGHSVLLSPGLPEEVLLALFPSLPIYINVTWIYSYRQIPYSPRIGDKGWTLRALLVHPPARG